jgi:serine phosphatase RsbU (regulator of sigma subunit)
MGHGISSALIALTVTQMFEDYAVFKPLDESVEAINTLLCTFNLEHQDRNKYVTGIFMEINFSENLLKIINAGHLDILLLDKNENPIHLRSNNMIMGVLESEYVTTEVKLSEIKNLFCFTDGLYENNGIEYEDALNRIDTLIRTKSSEKLFGTLLTTFGIEQDIKDDVTLCQILF